MLISAEMDLNELAFCMGAIYTANEAYLVREYLLHLGYDGEDTSNVPEGEWIAMCDSADDIASQQ